MTTKNDARNKQMIEQFKAGYTYAELALKNELSLSRVRKILRTARVSDSEGGLWVRAWLDGVPIIAGRLHEKALSSFSTPHFCVVDGDLMDELDRVESKASAPAFKPEIYRTWAPVKTIRFTENPIRWIANKLKGA